MHHQKIIKRLLYLRNWELFNIIFLPACLYFVLRIRQISHWQPYAVGMFCICIILAQGVFYWHLKLQSIRKNEATLPSYAYRVFSLFKWANLLLFSIYPLFVVLGKATTAVEFKPSFWPNFLFIFAILEYVNYYHYQLSHDNLNDIRYLISHRKIRRSPLWTDMQRNQKRV